MLYTYDMEKALLLSLNELADALKGDERVLQMRGMEKRMLDDSEVLILIAKKDQAEREYEDALSYAGHDDEALAQKQKALYLAKKELDEHPKVKGYTEAYIEVKDLYKKIDEIIFLPFRKGHHSC